MTDEVTEVTAPVDTQVNADRIEVETNIPAPEPEVVEPKVEPSEAPQTKTVNPRTEKRKAEKERLIRENAELKERTRAYEEQLKSKEAPKEAEKPAKDLSKEPNINDYEDVMVYINDLQDFKNLQIKEQIINERKQAEKEVKINSFVEDIRELTTEQPDIGEKIGQLADAGLIPEHIEDVIIDSPDRKELTKHFAQYPGDLIALNKLRPEMVKDGIKQIQAWIKTPKQAEAPRVTQAKPPIAPPGNNAKTDRSISSYSQEELENMPLAEFNRLTKSR